MRTQHIKACDLRERKALCINEPIYFYDISFHASKNT